MVEPGILSERCKKNLTGKSLHFHYTIFGPNVPKIHFGNLDNEKGSVKEMKNRTHAFVTSSFYAILHLFFFFNFCNMKIT